MKVNRSQVGTLRTIGLYEKEEVNNVIKTGYQIVSKFSVGRSGK